MWPCYFFQIELKYLNNNIDLLIILVKNNNLFKFIKASAKKLSFNDLYCYC